MLGLGLAAENLERLPELPQHLYRLHKCECNQMTQQEKDFLNAFHPYSKQTMFQHLENRSQRASAIDELILMHRNYTSGGDAWFAVMGFNCCREHGAPVPEWIMRWLSDGLSKFVEISSNQQKSKTRSSRNAEQPMLADLGRCLGVKTQTKIDRPTHLDDITESLSKNFQQQHVMFLRAKFEFTRDEACEIVAAHQKTTRITRRSGRLKSSLTERYKTEKWGASNKDFVCDLNSETLLAFLYEYKKLDLEPKTRARLMQKIEEYTQITEGGKMSDKPTLSKAPE